MEKEKNPMIKRGLSEDFPLEDRLPLTLYYLRDYPAFLKLGRFFGNGESYANRISHRVSEQFIERPNKGQKYYYSGKKQHAVKVQMIV